MRAHHRRYLYISKNKLFSRPTPPRLSSSAAPPVSDGGMTHLLLNEMNAECWATDRLSGGSNHQVTANFPKATESHALSAGWGWLSPVASTAIQSVKQDDVTVDVTYFWLVFP